MFCIIKIQNPTIYITSISSPENSRHWLARDSESLLLCRFCSALVGVFLVAQMVKDLHVVQETWVQSLDWEDSLEKGMATHSSILAWPLCNPMDREPGRLQSIGSQRGGHD